MFSTHSTSPIVGVLLPSMISANGRRLTYLLEDIYQDLRLNGIDILMVSKDRYQDESIFPWECIYPDEPLYAWIASEYDIFNIPALIFVSNSGELVCSDGMEELFSLSNMHEPHVVARMLSSKLIYDDDSDW